MNNPINSLLLIGLALAQTSGIVGGTNAAEPQPADQHSTSIQHVMEQARSRFPAAVAGLEAACAEPDTLAAVSYGEADGADYAGFYCWAPPGDDGSRSGQWLGRLPLHERDQPFAKPYRCPATDDPCAALWPQLQALYSSAIAQAEFNCAIKNGTLFLETHPNAVDLRCDFFATTVWDENGDGQVDYEDPVGVDISVTLLPLPQE
ncbi:hypothetical protein [Nodosilinea nodulosa]|uniref:hypothetical protein n=1 Tax=Nodosilinea nodulosa TaxID=416001 RepID=UPI00031E58C4|nr:hypothetical protein [Nodosilinea nodulosa]